MRVLKSLAGAGRITELSRIFREENGDIFVISGSSYGYHGAIGNFLDSEKDKVWFLSSLTVERLIEWATPLVIKTRLDLKEFKLYIYGDFTEADVQVFREWSDKYKHLSLVVTMQLPRNHSSDVVGPFVIEDFRKEKSEMLSEAVKKLEIERDSLRVYCREYANKLAASVEQEAIYADKLQKLTELVESFKVNYLYPKVDFGPSKYFDKGISNGINKVLVELQKIL